MQRYWPQLCVRSSDPDIRSEQAHAGSAVPVQFGSWPSAQTEGDHLQHLPGQAHHQHSRSKPSLAMLSDHTGDLRASPRLRLEQEGRQVQAPAPRPGRVVVDNRNQAPAREPEIASPEVALHQVIRRQEDVVEAPHGLTQTVCDTRRGTAGRLEPATLVRVTEYHMEGVLRPDVA